MAGEGLAILQLARRVVFALAHAPAEGAHHALGSGQGALQAQQGRQYLAVHLCVETTSRFADPVAALQGVFALAQVADRLRDGVRFLTEQSGHLG